MRGNGRVISGALVPAGVCAALALAGLSAAQPAAAQPPAARAATAAQANGPGTGNPAARGSSSTGAVGTQPVIVFLKKQLPGAGSRIRSEERSAEIQAAQAPYLGQLQADGATHMHPYRLVDAIAARVPASALGSISDSPGVAAVIPDSPIVGPSSAPLAARAPARWAAPAPAGGPAVADAASVKIPPGACSATPQLEPEGLALT
jgi:hypothetical protein